MSTDEKYQADKKLWMAELDEADTCIDRMEAVSTQAATQHEIDMAMGLGFLDGEV